MVSNSAIKPLKSTPNELPYITIDWWRIAWKMYYMHSRDAQHLIFQIGISKYYNCMYKTLLQIQSHIFNIMYFVWEDQSKKSALFFMKLQVYMCFMHGRQFTSLYQ